MYLLSVNIKFQVLLKKLQKNTL